MRKDTKLLQQLNACCHHNYDHQNLILVYLHLTNMILSHYFFFLQISLMIPTSVKTDKTETYTFHLSICQSLQQPKKNHGLHKLIMLMSDLNSHRRPFWLFL